MAGQDGNGRVDMLERMIGRLQEGMEAGFRRLEQKIDENRAALEQGDREFADRCRANRREIYDRLEKLELNQVRYFFVGAGLGFLLGTGMSAAVGYIIVAGLRQAMGG